MTTRDEFYITGGDDRIDLVLADTNFGINPTNDGVPLMSFDPASYYRHLKSPEDLLFVERWSFVVRDHSTDGVIALTRKLMHMLLKGWLFTDVPRYKEEGAIYLVQKVKCETGRRYSLVHSSPDFQMVSGLMNHPIEVAKLVNEVGISIARFAWETAVPGNIPSTKQSFTKLDGGPALPTLFPIANHFDDHVIDTIFRFDAAPAGYTNVTALTDHILFPAAPAVGDIYYVGANQPFWHIWWNLITAQGATGLTYAVEYSDGGAGWPTLTYGDDLMYYPDGGSTQIFNGLGVRVASFHPGDDWAVEDVNTVVRYWIRFRITALATYPVPPENGDYLVYNPRKPYAQLPSAFLGGDVPPAIQFRYIGFEGGDENVEMTNISRIIVGAKSRHIDDDEFSSHLNPGGDGLPTGWAVAYGDDTATQVDVESPGGDSALCDFSTETGDAMRVRFTGTNLARYYPGKYRPFLTCQQIGGDAGDVKVHLRIRIDSTAVFGPQIDTNAIATEGADVGFELIDLTPGSYIQIPFGVFFEADTLIGADMIFEIWAQRAAGAAEIEFYQLALIPVDEWSAEYQDPITNSTTGSSALRGNNIIIDDGGIVDDRCGKYVVDTTREWWIEWWERHGKAPMIIPLYDVPYRLYFIFAYYNASWGGAPMLALTGQSIMMEWIKKSRYLWLRGDD